MAYLLIRHRVEEFDRWKTAYDAHAGVRREAELKEKYLFRSTEDPHEVVILYEAADPEKALSFTRSTDLRNVMKKAGVTGEPEFTMLEESKAMGKTKAA